MATLDEVGEQDGWRCWICDEPVDPDRSVNDDRGPSLDTRTTAKRSKKKSKRALPPRLAHRACNTGKGNAEAVVPWADDLFLIDPVPIVAATERLVIKGGREVMARCLSADDADRALAWLTDRLSRLEPDLVVTGDVRPGGDQYLVVLEA
jgi:hypothetical protein